MELREFAERVLLTTSLEEKLRPPAAITDEHPGPPLATPAVPGRPAHLRFKPTGTARDTFPGTRQLEQVRERGRLLHFFANHELLATELMALVLLKFPAAPAAFRRGVLRTLQDEQEHTRLYLERMRTCGIAFGELPVSGYFWRAVSGMENPIDYVAGLCLTFEQANLDFARHFGGAFGQVGDAETAQLLDRIYHDEIGHVAYGLKWFRRWKQPNESDWEAFCRTLKFPLSPQRAKGLTLNVAGRRAAGLDSEFIAELDVYSQSRGRTPRVYVFNPFAEGYIAQGAGFNPTKHQAQLARDLENLPQFLGRQDDIVLVHRRPAVTFLSTVKAAGFPLPEFVELRGAGLHAGDFAAIRQPLKVAPGLKELAQRKLGGLRPWAWSPDSVARLAPLFARLTAEPRTAAESFNPDIAQLYSKAWSAGLLRRLLRAGTGGAATDRHSGDWRDASPSMWLCTELEVGVAVDSMATALAAIAAIRARGHQAVVVKEALGVAGSNAIRLLESELLETQRRWLANALARGRQLVVEPWLERVMDFSVQLEMTREGCKLCGYTGLLTDAHGQFQGNWAAPKFERRLPPTVREWFAAPSDIATRLQALFDGILLLLEAELRQAGYFGPVGIDAFVYRDAQGRCRLKPIVEINPRHTMGRVTVELMKHAAPGSHGWFRLWNLSAVRRAGFPDFVTYAAELGRRQPLRLEGKPLPRIREGVLFLNDPACAQVALAVFQVGRELPPDFPVQSPAQTVTHPG